MRLFLLVALAGAFCGVPATATAQQLFSDDFNGSTLSPGWTVVSPNPASTNRLTGTALNVVAAWVNGGSDLWGGSNYRAPRALQAVDPTLDWTVETKFDFSPSRDYQDAGLLLAKTNGAFTSDGDYWRIAMRSFYPAGGGQVIRAVGSYVNYSGTTSYLRIEKSGPVYTGRWSSNGVTWTLGGSATNTGWWPYVGIVVIRQAWDGAAVDSSATFDYLHAQSYLPAPPTITSATRASGTTDWHFTYQITATGNPTGYGASGTPAGLSVNSASGLLSGTTTNSGTCVVLLRATNYVGVGTTNLTLAVSPNLAVQWPTAQGGNGHWYRAVLFGPSGINWGNAQAAAGSRGGYLATITSAAENAFAYNLVSDTRFWFIDAYGNGLGPWLGGLQPPGSPEPTGNWQWATGEPMAYTNWAAGQPDNFGGAEDRIQFFGTGTLQGSPWNDIGASVLLRGYLIEYNESPDGPWLSVTRSNTAVVVSWRAPAEGWLLHASTNLVTCGSLWTEIPPPYQTNGLTNISFTEPSPTGNTFYRLHAP